ncbi:MAG: carboxymuconolactone decarboxylase family protein [Aestuariivirga sp.]|uniref:carboxymuconolactone decarboxylase family protein n=1 Tax=Aestuariivirga sp. TaxID=2650926 RepID=UPI0038D02EE7
MADAKEKLDGVNARLLNLFEAEKQTMMAFNGLATAATRAGKISPAMKELTAVAIAVAKGCEDCIIYHAAAAKKHGATRDELAEMLAVSVEMAGGPGAVYAAKALETFDQLP